jgi:GNAT superfamily N-acetyltransferase
MIEEARVAEDRVRIVRATVAEAATVVALVDGLLAELRGGKSGLDLPAAETLCETLLAEHRYTAFLATEDDTPIGVITLTETTTIYARGTLGVIQELYVIPAARSRGIGHRLIAAAEAEGRLWRWRGLQVGAPNATRFPRSVAFYEREGFRVIGPRLGRGIA